MLASATPMLRSLTLCLLVALPTACSLSPEHVIADLHLPASTTQVLLSTTLGWNDTGATVLCLQRTDNGWQRIGEPIAATVGRSGLGWGVGEHQDGDGPRKQEGDGRSPAGVFALGTAFGYAPEPPAGVRVAYRCATARDYFVDAAESPDYNQWRHIADEEANDPASRWRSFEHMRRDDDLYEYGMVVEHNTDPLIPGRGSAIFLHVWSAPGSPTGGCTAMARADLLRVLRWLRPDAQPRLVQAPAEQLGQLRLAGS